LIRLLCEKCKKPYTPEEEEFELVKNVMAEHPHPYPLPNPLTLFKSVGCDICGGTGFKGRAGIFEGVVVDEAVEEVVIRDPREHIILEAAKPQGIPTMVQDGMDKVIKGQTSIKELERVIELPHFIKGVALTPPVTNEVIDEDDFSSHIV
jgi:type II secretory ATPase GspE/PulE/Tfp pilus assembly ATPase PilB-like protein